jgi:hypothetical protein
LDKIQVIEKLFSYILVYSYLLLPLFFLFCRAKKNPIVICLLVYGIIFYLFLNFYFDIPKSFRKIQQTVYTFLEYSFFAYLFWFYIKQIRLRKIILLLSFLFLCFQVFYFFESKLQRVDSIPVGIETILILTYTFIYFQQYFTDSTTTYVYNDPSFWIVVGILIYLGSSFFFNILANDLSQEYWYWTYIPEIIKNILFAISIIIISNKPRNSLPKSSSIPNLDMI